MTSLDDTIISQQNLRLLDNVTNYSKESIDYFHYTFTNKEYQASWNLLSKRGKQKIIRLPSCSNEYEEDYFRYQKRLHNCLWRRWSIKQFKLNELKSDPLKIDWNKEIDVTLLYGPDLTVREEMVSEVEIENSHIIQNEITYEEELVAEVDYDSEYDDDDDDTSSVFDYSESVHSNASSIHENKNHKHVVKSLKFNDFVLRRDINNNGNYIESHTIINDIVSSYGNL